MTDKLVKDFDSLQIENLNNCFGQNSDQEGDIIQNNLEVSLKPQQS